MEIISFLQDRISQAYTEQVWTVATLGVFHGFIISNHDKITGIVKNKSSYLKFSIIAFGVIGILFVVSRHFIFEHYNDFLKQELVKNGYQSLFDLTFLERIGQGIIYYSGVVIYSLVILILSLGAFFSLKKTKHRRFK